MVVRTVQCQRRLSQFEIMSTHLLEHARYIFCACRYVIIGDPEILVGVDQFRICAEQIEDSAPLPTGRMMSVFRAFLQSVRNTLVSTKSKVPG